MPITRAPSGSLNALLWSDMTSPIFAGIKKSVRLSLMALTGFVLLVVLGLGWLQYQQMERLSHTAARGFDQSWMFSSLELQLSRYQTALSEAISQPGKLAVLQALSKEYDLFASQVLSLQLRDLNETQLGKSILNQANTEAQSYMAKADPFLSPIQSTQNSSDFQALLVESHALRATIHNLVVAAHELQTKDATLTLEHIRMFSVYGAVTTAFLLLLSMVAGSFAVAQLGLAGHRQIELERLHQEVSHKATHDFLTELVNRSEFENRLRRTLDLARKHGTAHALMLFDLDHFKPINDTCGHAAGDQVLRDVAQLVNACMRTTDTLGRLGGDEFGVILLHCDLHKAVQVAEQIRSKVEAYQFDHEGQLFHIGASIGLVQIHQRWPSIEVLVKVADAACYSAKKSGRNCVHVHEDKDEVAGLTEIA